jgi:hypothetical protein
MRGALERTLLARCLAGSQLGFGHSMVCIYYGLDVEVAHLIYFTSYIYWCHVSYILHHIYCSRRHLDVNGDGRLSRSEVQAVIGSLMVGSTQEAQAAQEEVVLLAADGQDDIDFAGFLAFFATVPISLQDIPLESRPLTYICSE